MWEIFTEVFWLIPCIKQIKVNGHFYVHSLWGYKMLEAGVFRRMVVWVRDYVRLHHPKQGLQILDKRFSKTMELGTVPKLRLPTVKHLWQAPKSLQANEYRSIMQVLYPMLPFSGNLMGKVH